MKTQVIVDPVIVSESKVYRGRASIDGKEYNFLTKTTKRGAEVTHQVQLETNIPDNGLEITRLEGRITEALEQNDLW